MLGRHWVLVSIIALAAIVGCSRQGAVISNRLSKHSPEIGDRAEYSIDGKVALFGTNVALQSTGRRTSRVVAPTNRRRPVPAYIVRSFDLREDQFQQIGGQRAKRSTAVTRLGEDASGNLYLLGESLDGRKWEFTADATLPLYMPAEIRSDSAWGYAAKFDTGSEESVAYRCVGMERITTPAGQYEAFKISEKVTRSGLPSYAGYIWISPDLPYVLEVKLDVTSNDPVQGIPAKTEMDNTLESVRLVR